jgi:hypothetical protein
MDQTGGSRVRAVAAAAGAGFLVMVVAAGAGFDDVGVPGRFFSFDAEAMAGYVVPLLRFAYLALLVVAFYRWLVTREGRRRGRARRRPPSFLATFLALVLLTGGIFLFMATVDRSPVATTTTSFPEVAGSDQSVPAPNAAPPLADDPGWGLVLLALAGLAGAAFLAVHRSRPPAGVAVRSGTRPRPVRPTGVGKAVPISDTTRARVYDAYRQVEETARRSGKERATYETVATHLRRLTPSAPSRSLTQAYHRARFSPLEVTEETAVTAEEAAGALTRELE